MISLDTEGSPSKLNRGKIAFIKQNKWMLLKLYPIFNYSVLDTMIFITIGSVLEVKKFAQAPKNLELGIDRIGRILIKEKS